MERSLDRDRILRDVTDTFRQAYRSYLLERGLGDNATSKIAFYCSLELVVRTNPHPDTSLQDALIRHIDSMIEESMRGETFLVDKLVEDLGAEKMRQRSMLSIVKPGEEYDGVIDAADAERNIAFEHKLQAPARYHQ